MKRLLLTFALLLVSAPLNAQDQVTFPPASAKWFTNTDGSCVFCSIGHCGWWHNEPKATYGLWDTDEYGRRWRGGAWPSRVADFAKAREIALYNVTGSETYDWMKWASKTGRMCAIGCYSAHFQTLLYYNDDPADKRPWKVKNNWAVSGGNNITTYNEFTESEFKRYHEQSGKWVVILKAPPPPVQPKYIAWWQ